MKKVLFLVSHVGSGSDALYALLNSETRIMGFDKNNIYDSPIQLVALTENKHKLNNSSRIYMDHLLYNYQYCLKPNPHCQFIFLVREPEGTIDYLVNRKIYKKQDAKRYYLYRIRRICELLKRNPDSVFITYSNLREGKGLDIISEYIGLKNVLKFSQEFIVPSGKNTLQIQDYEKLSSAYEKYVYFANKVCTKSVK